METNEQTAQVAGYRTGERRRHERECGPDTVTPVGDNGGWSCTCGASWAGLPSGS